MKSRLVLSVRFGPGGSPSGAPSHFPLIMGVIGFFAFDFSVLGATVIDPVATPGSYHPVLGYWIFPLGALVALPIYIINGSPRLADVNSRTLLSSLALAVAGVLSSLSYGYFLHLGVLSSSLSYSLIVGLLIRVSYFIPRSKDIVKLHIPLQAKIDAVKMEFNLWFNTFVLVVTTIAVAASVTVFRAFEVAKQTYASVEAAGLETLGVTIQAAYFGILAVALASLMLRNMTRAYDVLKEIPPEDDRDGDKWPKPKQVPGGPK